MVSDSFSPMLLAPAADSDLAEVICVLNANGVIRFATPAAAHFIGYQLSEIVGRSALRFVVPNMHETTIQCWMALRDEPAAQSDEMLLTLIASNGRRVPIQATAWRLPNRDEFLLVLHLVEHLRDRLDTLNAILNDLSGRLEINPMLDTVQREVFRLIPSAACTVYLTEDDGQVRVRRWDQAHMDDYRVPLAELREFGTTRTMRDTGRPVIIRDTQTDPRWEELEAESDRREIRSWLGVPLIHRTQYLGELNLDSQEPDAFSEQDAELALALAGQIAAVVFHARQFEAEQRRAKRYRVLNDINQAISHLDLNSVLELVYRNLSQLMDTSTFFIGLYDAETEIVRLVGAYDHGRKSPDEVQRADEGITGLVLRTRESLIVLDSESEPLPDMIIIQDEMPISLLMMPLITQDEMVGVISVQSYKPYAYTQEDIAMLDTIAGAVATAVRNAQLYDQAVERFRTLETLHQMSMELAVVQQPDAIARLVTRAALELFKPNVVRLCLCEDQSCGDVIWNAHATVDPTQLRVETRPLERLHSLVEQVRDTGRPVLIPDMSVDPALQHEFGTPWLVHAAAIYPIQRGDHLFAIVSLLYAVPTFFRQDMLRTLDLLALEAATAFQNARYLDTLRRQLGEVTALQDLARQVSGLHSLDDVLDTVVQTLLDVYECRSTWVALLEADEAMISIRASAGLRPEYEARTRFPVGAFGMGQVVETGEPLYVPDTYNEPRFKIIDPGVRSMMVVPLTVHGQVLGALGIDGATVDAFSDAHERVLSIAGGQIAATIETIHLLQQAQDRADDLAAANAILKEQDELRKELVYQVSHDLRSPLQLVYGYADRYSGADAQANQGYRNDDA
jgi:PAS domain S-box-containing protein